MYPKNQGKGMVPNTPKPGGRGSFGNLPRKANGRKQRKGGGEKTGWGGFHHLVTQEEKPLGGFGDVRHKKKIEEEA